MKPGVSRRTFFSGLAAALGALGIDVDLLAQGRGQPPAGAPRVGGPMDDYDAMAKLANNENPYGPPESVMKAMNSAWKYSNRYEYPDGEIVPAIAEHHGVTTSHILLGAGSGEILNVVGTTFLVGGKKVLGVEPTYGSVYQHATSIRSEAIRLPLKKDYTQNIPLMIATANKRAAEIGFVYLCNPNNPTGMIVTKDETRQLLDGIPKDMPVLIDEAYHHFVESPQYGTAIPYVLEGRPVIVTRTFSKAAALAGMRLGYAVAPPALILKMRPWVSGSTSALVKWGAAASLKDVASQQKVKEITLRLRKKTTSELQALGYDVLPSEANFFMVHIGRQVRPVIDAFRKKGVLVGRPFPPMTQHLRVSVGTEAEMHRFMMAFKEILPAKATTAGE